MHFVAGTLILFPFFYVAIMLGIRLGRKQMREELFAGIVMQKMNAAAQAIQPVVTKDNEFAKGARMASKAIFSEFGIGYKNGGE
jgi:hypothetical protein